MIDRSAFDLPLPAASYAPPASTKPALHDASLFLEASTRWRASARGWRSLLASSPGIRDTIDDLLKRELDLDGRVAGLLFAPVDSKQGSFVSFTDACAFVLQHPTLETDLDRRCQVSGVPLGHPLSRFTPSQMLERLKSLAPEQAHGERWRKFWEGRASGAAVSRQAWALQNYRDHFEAAAQLASAEKILTKEQLAPLLLMINPPEGALMLDDLPIHTEQLALVLSNQSRVKLTGAWVITVGDSSSTSNLLYLPSRPIAIQRFDQRSAMEDWLSRQSLVPIGLPAADLKYEYTAQTDPLTLGASDLLAAHHQAQITALRHGLRGKSGVAEFGTQALQQVEQVETQLRGARFFASPPEMPVAPEEIEVDQALFGSLYADIPRGMREAALAHQREALEKLSVELGDGDAQQPLKDSLKALDNAEKAGDVAAETLLYRARALDLATFQQAFTDLHAAHKAGLHAEASVQVMLKQLGNDEHDLLKALLDTPDDPGADPVAASLTLSLTEKEGDETTVRSAVLRGVVAMTRADALVDVDSPHSVLLYWPGNGGGLQRFANRRELERELLRIFPQDSGSSVQLSKITGDALLYGLNQLTSEFEEQAGPLRQSSALPDQTAQQAEQLDILRKRTHALLQVPVNAARTLALTHIEEQDRSSALASDVPGWLSASSEPDRLHLKSLIEAYIAAMHRSHDLMTIALEPRDDFTRKRLDKRLREDFSLKGSFSVTLDLPDSVRKEYHFIEAPGAPGTPRKMVLVPSAARGKMSLEDLAQHNIDNSPSLSLEPLVLRLAYMQVEVTASDETERLTLKDGITLDWLKRVLPGMDLPKAYETQIREAFYGGASESTFVIEHRRESLIEPWSLMLKLQGEVARLQKQINARDLQVLNIAINASNPEAWTAGGKQIVLWPACLSPGGKDTPG